MVWLILHYGVQPAIIHRDVKASYILLDKMFTPGGLSHMSTLVARTLGYVAPKHALYGQLS